MTGHWSILQKHPKVNAVPTSRFLSILKGFEVTMLTHLILFWLCIVWFFIPLRHVDHVEQRANQHMNYRHIMTYSQEMTQQAPHRHGEPLGVPARPCMATASPRTSPTERSSGTAASTSWAGQDGHHN